MQDCVVLLYWLVMDIESQCVNHTMCWEEQPMALKSRVTTLMQDLLSLRGCPVCPGHITMAHVKQLQQSSRRSPRYLASLSQVNLAHLSCCQSACGSHISNGLFWMFCVHTEPYLTRLNVQAHYKWCTVGEGNSSNPLKQVLNAIEEKVECVTYDRVSKCTLHGFALKLPAPECSVAV